MGIHKNTKPIIRNMSAPAKKASKPKAPAAHPKYSVMIAAAITSLKDRTGSSRQAILKYICANYKVDAAKAAVQVRLALKRGVAKGALKMARASGKGAGSYKVVKAEKPQRPRSPRRSRRQRSLQPRRLRSQRRLPRNLLPRKLPKSLLPRRLPRSQLPRRLPPRRSKDLRTCISVVQRPFSGPG